jgi:poly(hydroxyalkanoate) depolymerase family esterase
MYCIVHCSNQFHVWTLSSLAVVKKELLVIDFGNSEDRLKIWKALATRLQPDNAQFPKSPFAGGPSRLAEVYGFGSNPGNLRMFRYIPSLSPEKMPLVVVLHGCGQTAEGYNHGAGWSTLCDRHGFALLMPEQQRSNNPNGCLNWFQPEDTQRDRGEALSICQMVQHMVRDGSVDPDRIFITGLSAGGAMTSVMLACYPDLFAAGAIIAGLPYGAASNVQQAFESMYQCPSRSARHWGDLVRAAGPSPAGSSPTVRWPRISIWHGNADKTVIPRNAGEIIKQWTDVHGLALQPSLQDTVDGYPRQVWINDAGDEVIESYSITRMAHGTPLATAQAEIGCGEAGPFLLEAGISSSFHIAKFFGLAGEDWIRPENTSLDDEVIPDVLPVPHHLERPNPQQPPLGPMALSRGMESTRPPSNLMHGIDIGAVITRALEAAGLMKRN